MFFGNYFFTFIQYSSHGWRHGCEMKYSSCDCEYCTLLNYRRLIMSNLSNKDEWWTAPAEAENGNIIFVTGRKGLQRVMEKGKHIYRVEMVWTYAPDAKGMPSQSVAKLMGEVQDALETFFAKDSAVVNTGIYTGDGERNWVFYTRSLPLFQGKINRALAPFEQLPLTFRAFEDPKWEEYREMCLAEINATN